MQIARLLGSLITARSDLEMRAQEMSGDVGAQAPSWFALDMACRKLRRTCKFPPVIAEVLEALEEAGKKIGYARKFAERLPRQIEEAAAELQKRISREEDSRIRAIADCKRRIEDGKSVDWFTPDVLHAARRQQDG